MAYFLQKMYLGMSSFLVQNISFFPKRIFYYWWKSGLNGEISIVNFWCIKNQIS